MGSVIGAFVVVALVAMIVVIRQKRFNEMFTEKFERPKADEWEYDPLLVKLGMQLGEGAFGIVMSAMVKDIQPDVPGTVKVAVKMCPPNATVTDKKDFLAECNLMKKFSRPWHPNVRTCQVIVFRFRICRRHPAINVESGLG